MLGVGKDGPMLLLGDENGEFPAMLMVCKDRTGVFVCDENGKLVWSAPR